MVEDYVGGCRLCRSDHANFIAPRCNNQGGKEARLRRRNINDLTCYLTPRTTHPLHRGIQQSYPK
jgi:hypothetical protein